jgi:hypothetical protein
LESVEPAELRRIERGLLLLTRAMGIDGEPAEMLFEDASIDATPSVSPSRSGRTKRT